MTHFDLTAEVLALMKIKTERDKQVKVGASNLSTRLLGKVDINEVSGCWEWRGAKSRGYGCLSVGGKQCRANRVAYETWVGPIPEGDVVRHKCDNPPCINPDHLELGTQLDNMRDASSRGRTRRGEDNPCAKLTSESVAQMRTLYFAGFFTPSELGYLYGVPQPTARRAIKGLTWK